MARMGLVLLLVVVAVDDARAGIGGDMGRRGRVRAEAEVAMGGV